MKHAHASTLSHRLDWLADLVNLSLDRLLARGLARTAVPFAAATLSLCADATRWLAPLYTLVLRLWLAFAIPGALAIASSNGSAGDVVSLLPVTSAATFAAPLTLVCATLVALGYATRPTALLLIVAISAVRMMGLGVEAYPYWFMALALVALWGPGPGPVSLDALVERALRRRFPQLSGQPAFSLDGVPRVVIVGAGFGGLTCAAALTRARVAVTVIDRHNYHLFQPLLYQVATSGLSPGDIATPVRGLFREHFNVRVLFGEVSSVDRVRREVLMDGQRIAYDYLVLATGAAHSYFGRDDWAPHAPGLKRVEDATEVRRRLLTAFEQAEVTDDPAEQASLLTFLIANAWNGTPVPGLAPAAKQGGDYVAQVIRARVEGRPAPASFRYQHLGSLATIGRKAAVADFGFVKLHGGLAWWLWGAVHLGFLVGLRNRTSVVLDWFWAYLTYRSGTRLITGGAGSQKTEQMHATDALQRQGAA
ncbi:membrane hypothetical protein [Candidatus Accumulibacter aalborgensis]|uniref:Uncharacterized protein n=1 Tax=Candidatus Accumulibacter aalborgensis TaxID=1860102 RepID=A0A1A8XN16_9PROT|nr:FAD-dependent oxidoreductase [Candidatus Accumulibacter aalborgensis]SBT06550.1 membrane hypothetical protein [Candidatus Accumulibacter aalborgensis]